MLEMLVFLPFFLVFWLVDSLKGFYLVYFSAVVPNFGTAISPFFFPKILFGLDAKAYSARVKKTSTASREEKPDALSKQKADEISVSIGLVLDQNKGFLQHGYSIHDLSVDTDFPVYVFTIYINKVLKSTFPGLINQRRIEECCEMIKSG